MRSRSVCLAVAAALSVALWSGTAQADLNNPTHNGIKGAIGLGLLGADLTLIIEGAVGVRHPALLSVLPLVIGGGAAAGGYFAGRESAAGAVAMLVSGMALIIPAAILVAHGRSYRASRDDQREGFVDRTEEGMPPPDENDLDVFPEGEAETEVIGPDDEEETSPEPPPAQEEEAPAPEPQEGDDTGPSAMGSPLWASVRLDGQLPVGGVLRLVAEQWSQSSSLTLSLTYF